MEDIAWPIKVVGNPDVLIGEWIPASKSKSTSFWRKEDPLLEYKSDDPESSPIVKVGGMFNHQRLWWESDNFIKVLVTGYGGGKTLIAAKRCIAMALYNAPSPVICVSPTFKIARRTTIPTIRALLQGKEVQYRGKLKWRFNKTDFEFTIWFYGAVATIWILSGEDPDALKGANAASALIDEPFIQEKGVFDQILARVRDPIARKREICLTGTPEQLNWGYDICEGEEKDNYDLEFFNASTRENKALPKAYSSTLESAYSEKAALAYVEGKFVSLSTGLVYYAFDPIENVVNLPEDTHEVFAGMDFNVNPMAFIVFWVHGDHMHVIREYEIPNSDTEDAAIILKRDWGRRLQSVYPDPSGKNRSTKAPGGRSDFHILEENGFEVFATAAHPARRDRFNAVNGKLKSRKQKATLTIAPECKKIKRYMMEYSHELMNQQKAMSHLLDAVGYPVAYLFPIEPEIQEIEVMGTAFV